MAFTFTCLIVFHIHLFKRLPYLTNLRGVFEELQVVVKAIRCKDFVDGLLDVNVIIAFEYISQFISPGARLITSVEFLYGARVPTDFDKVLVRARDEVYVFLFKVSRGLNIGKFTHFIYHRCWGIFKPRPPGDPRVEFTEHKIYVCTSFSQPHIHLPERHRLWGLVSRLEDVVNAGEFLVRVITNAFVMIFLQVSVCR